MLTIIFYGSDGAAAKLRAREISADKANKTRVYDAFSWNGDRDACDVIEIMPCVPEWRRARIEDAFAGKIAEPSAADDVVIPKRRGRPPNSSKGA